MDEVDAVEPGGDGGAKCPIVGCVRLWGLVVYRPSASGRNKFHPSIHPRVGVRGLHECSELQGVSYHGANKSSSANKLCRPPTQAVVTWSLSFESLPFTAIA